MNRRAFIATAVALTALAPACSEGGERGPACPDGAVVAYEGHDYCVVGLPIIETGFRCPPQFPFGMDGGDFRVCGTGEPWLARPHLNDLRCLVSVGVNQESCYKYEQGLGAAWAALDPIGPNALQSAGFLRPEAHLAILIVSDEDDCSVAPGATVSEDDYETCSFLKTVAAGGPLLDPAEVAQRFI